MVIHLNTVVCTCPSQHSWFFLVVCVPTVAYCSILFMCILAWDLSSLASCNTGQMIFLNSWTEECLFPSLSSFVLWEKNPRTARNVVHCRFFLETYNLYFYLRFSSSAVKKTGSLVSPRVLFVTVSDVSSERVRRLCFAISLCFAFTCILAFFSWSKYSC